MWRRLCHVQLDRVYQPSHQPYL